MPRAKVAAAEHIVATIVDSNRDTQGKAVGGRKASMKSPLRSLSDLACSVPTVRVFAQTLRGLALPKRLIETSDRANGKTPVDLNDVMDEYLPAQLQHPETFLP